MPLCCECADVKCFPTVKALVFHLQIFHKFNVSSKYSCGEKGCCAKFDNVHSFKKHLRSIHSFLNVTGVCSKTCSEVERVESEVLPDLDINSENPVNMDTEEYYSAEDFKNSLKSQSDAFVAKLYSKPGIPRNHVQNVINDTDAFPSSGFLSLLREKVLLSLNTCNADLSEIHDIQSMFDALQNPFSHLKTEYHRMKYFTKSGHYIAPETYVFGKRLMNVKTKHGLRAKWVDVSAEFISLHKVLKKFLELPKCLSDICAYIDYLKHESETISNFVQGKLWLDKRKNYKVSDIVLPLFIYFDDFETNNPLGPHSGKVGGVYASIPCVPPECQSTIENIFLACLFESSDRKEFGNMKIFKPLIEELKCLEKEGIVVETPDGNKQVYVVLGLLMGDNLGIHQLGGFAEGFTANFCCRFCKAFKTDTNSMVRDDKSLLRNMENYTQDVEISNVTLSGINEACCFNDIPSFHITSNYFVDIMHDVLEGVFHYVMLEVLNHCVKEKFFTIESLNFRIEMFDYGLSTSNKIPLFNEDSLTKSKLKMTASETLYFVRYFGLMVGDLVPENVSCWRLYLSLLEVTHMLMAKTVPKTMSISVCVVIEELLSLYISLGNKLKPKFHHLLHYAMIMENSGPVSNLSCMRFEAKHRQLKQSANVNMSRVNICHSLAVKHQLNLCNRFIANQSIIPEMDIGPVDHIDITNHEFYDSFKRTLPVSLQEHNSTFIPSWIDYKGTRYSHNMVLLVTDEGDFGWPFSFGKLEIILIDAGVPVFICSRLKIVGLNGHFGAYEVQHYADWFCVTFDDLLDPLPVHCHAATTGESYVILRYCV